MLAWDFVQLVFWMTLMFGLVVVTAAGILAPPVALGVFLYRRFVRAVP